MRPRHLLVSLLQASGLPALVRATAQRRRLTVLLYHAPPPEVLDAHLTVLGKRYSFVPLREALDGLAAGDPLPPRPLVLTLDDGHASNRALLPVLARHRVRATVFLCTAVVGTRRHFWFLDPARPRGHGVKELSDAERLEVLRAGGFEETREYPDRHALTWEEVEEMREWVDFQPHTRFHPILPRCTDERAAREIAGSREDLIERGFEVHTLAYPNGDYGEREAVLAREAGYRNALTIDPGFCGPGDDPFLLRRLGIPDDASAGEALVRASGLYSRLRVLLRGRYQTRNRPGRAGTSGARGDEGRP